MKNGREEESASVQAAGQVGKGGLWERENANLPSSFENAV